MSRHSFRWLLVFILAAEGAGFVGLLFMGSSDAWYATLPKPALNPPPWLFGPVWGLLYALMGAAAYLVWQRRGGASLGLYWAQLIVNAVWTPLFFGLQNPILAFVDIVILLVLIVWTFAVFVRLHRVAGILLIPYIVWVAFAAYLNGAIVLLR
jgi:translocator protein